MTNSHTALRAAVAAIAATVMALPTGGANAAPAASPNLGHHHAAPAALGWDLTAVVDGGEITLTGTLPTDYTRVRVRLGGAVIGRAAVRQDGSWSVTVPVPDGGVGRRSRLVIEQYTPKTTFWRSIQLDRLPEAEPAPELPVEAPTPRGNPAAFSYLEHANPHWSSCSLQWKVNPDRMPAGAMDVLAGVFDRAGAATGIRFTYTGSTGVIPFAVGHSMLYPGSHNTIHVAFSDQQGVPSLAGNIVAYGGWQSEAGSATITAGGVTFDVEDQLVISDAPGVTLGTVFAHELGHALGLGHVDDADQLMYSTFTRATSNLYQRGDLTGLANIGTASGCQLPGTQTPTADTPSTSPEEPPTGDVPTPTLTEGP